MVVIEPGAVISEIAGRGVAPAGRLGASVTPDRHGRYDALIAAVITEVVTATKPRTRYTVGRGAGVLRPGRPPHPDRAVERKLRRTLNRPTR